MADFAAAWKKVNDNTTKLIDKLNKKANIDSPALTGVPTAPTAPTPTYTDQIATCKFVHNVAAFDTYVTYTVQIDTSNSNPDTSCVYQDDAVGMGKGAAAWDSKPIFNQIKPCVFKDGKVAYYLNPNNFNLKADGEASVLTGADGDVMIEFARFGIKIWTEDPYLYVSITNDPRKMNPISGYRTYAFSRNSEGDLDKIYYGAYKASDSGDGKLRSISGAKPIASKTIAQYKTMAQAVGANYTSTSWAPLVALQCLYVIKYCNLNGQTALGLGIVGRSGTTTAANYGPLNTGGTETFGMYYGDKSNNGSSTDLEQAKLAHIKFAGVEDFWGNIWEWVNDLTSDANHDLVVQNIAGTFVTHTDITTDSYGYVTKVAGNTEAGFFGVKHGGSTSTYYCDYGYLYASRICAFGGRWYNGLGAGPFRLYAYSARSAAGADVSSRLLYL